MMVDLVPPTSIMPRPSPIDPTRPRLLSSFVDAIVGVDFDRLQPCSRRMCGSARSSPADAGRRRRRRVLARSWRTGSAGRTARELIGWTVDAVGDRLALGYRLELTEDGERRVVEQHVAAIVDGAVFRDLRCCVWLRRLTAHRRPGREAARGLDRGCDVAEAPASKPGGHLDATGLSCAT